MRSNWTIRIITIILFGLFTYFFYNAYKHYQTVNNQQPDRPSVSQTLNEIGNGKDATLEAEDAYDEDENYDLSADNAISTIKDGVSSTGTAVAGGAAAAGAALKNGMDKTGSVIVGSGEAIKEGVSNTGAAIKEGGAALKEKASKYIPTDPSINDLVALKEAEAQEMEESESRNNADSQNNVTTYNSNAAGDYLVVAGTFRQMINAEQELAKLKNKGYDNASIAKFNNSAYASLIVDRFNTSAEAKQYVKSLKSKGMDAYVHKKR